MKDLTTLKAILDALNRYSEKLGIAKSIRNSRVRNSQTESCLEEIRSYMDSYRYLLEPISGKNK